MSLMETQALDAASGPERLDTPLRVMVRKALRHPGLLAGTLVILAMTIIAVFAPLIAPHDPYVQDLSRRLTPPVWDARGSWAAPLGTDALGRDYLSRLIWGARVSLAIGFGAALISGVIGTTLGVCAGYFGGKVDLFVTFLINIRLALPAMLVALAVVALVGGSLHTVVLVLGLLIWDRFAVVMRSTTQQLRDRDYLVAARLAGCSAARIILTEVMPNLMASLMVVATLEVAHAVLLEASLSFLGLGVQPPTPSWGLMVAEGKSNMFSRPWIIAIPGLTLFLLVFAVNMFGDGLRDVTAPEGRS